MRIKQTDTTISIYFKHPEGFMQHIRISREEDCDRVIYLDDKGDSIIEMFKEDGLYNCGNKKMEGEHPWLYPRGSLRNNRDGTLCIFCKYCHDLCNLAKVVFEKNRIIDCDRYQRWDE